jgi:hypothetical protein
MDKTLKRGSVTMTESSITIAFSKEAPTTEPSKRIGYDLNEKSIVGSDGTRYHLGEVARLHTLYGVRRSEFYERRPHDRRLRKKFASSRREGACEPGSPQSLDADRRKGENEQRGDRPREAEGDQVRPQERERGKNREAAQGSPFGPS